MPGHPRPLRSAVARALFRKRVSPAAVPQPAGERGGPKGPEPTRYGDWERNGRCSDF